jgi:hypothetical protein
LHNGGFLQFFWNSTGILAPEAIEGFNAIGMPNLASIVSEATRFLGAPFPRSRDDRWDALLSASDRNEEELEAIFKNNTNFYLAFVEATKGLNLDLLDKKAWALSQTENGDFGNAATKFAQNLNLFTGCQ